MHVYTRKHTHTHTPKVKQHAPSARLIFTAALCDGEASGN